MEKFAGCLLRFFPSSAASPSIDIPQSNTRKEAHEKIKGDQVGKLLSFSVNNIFLSFPLFYIKYQFQKNPKQTSLYDLELCKLTRIGQRKIEGRRFQSRCVRWRRDFSACRAHSLKASDAEDDDDGKHGIKAAECEQSRLQNVLTIPDPAEPSGCLQSNFLPFVVSLPSGVSGHYMV